MAMATAAIRTKSGGATRRRKRGRSAMLRGQIARSSGLEWAEASEARLKESGGVEQRP
jgi:hypothetical protein